LLLSLIPLAGDAAVISFKLVIGALVKLMGEPAPDLISLAQTARLAIAGRSGMLRSSVCQGQDRYNP
jgi:hypothetical protein